MFTRNALAAVVLGLLIALPAQAEYASIQANLLNGVPDTSFSGGVLTINSNSSTTQLTLNDPDPLAGSVTNMDLMLSTNFHHAFLDGPDIKALFTGGYFSLDFIYDGSPYYIEGPIEGMVFYVSSTSPSLSFIAGEGLFNAIFDLPGSGDWPAPAQSSIKSLSLAFGFDLGDYDWTSPLEGNIETTMTLYPDDSAAPGPAALFLLVPGLALLRRR